MKHLKTSVLPALKIFLIFTVVCGVIYTAAITGFAQIVFPDKANGSIIEVDGKKYGCELLGQQYTDESHMWGRIMNIDVSTYTDENGKALMYAAPSNISPASEEYKLLCLLSKNVGKVLTHTFITQKNWGRSWDNDVASLRVFMATLRKKLEPTEESPQYIQTHIGVGYRMIKVN